LSLQHGLAVQGLATEAAAAGPRDNEKTLQEAARRGIVIGQSFGPVEALQQHQRLSIALNRLKPQRKGIVDTYVLAAGLDSDPVFKREAKAAGDALSRRYGGEGRVMVLAVGPEAEKDGLPDANPNHLAAALGGIGARMDKDEDVLVLFLTTHGHWLTGLSYRDGERALGNIAPPRLAQLLNEAGIKNRLIILSACYSGIFTSELQNQSSIIFTAASADKPSFGCQADNDWTFFGDAFINHALRQPTPTLEAFAAARSQITQWEVALRLAPSNPQVDVGSAALTWLTQLDTRAPKTPQTPTGKPSFTPPT
jgi:hypothetical protein